MSEIIKNQEQLSNPEETISPKQIQYLEQSLPYMDEIYSQEIADIIKNHQELNGDPSEATHLAQKQEEASLDKVEKADKIATASIEKQLTEYGTTYKSETESLSPNVATNKEKPLSIKETMMMDLSNSEKLNGTRVAEQSAQADKKSDSLFG